MSPLHFEESCGSRFGPIGIFCWIRIHSQGLPISIRIRIRMRIHIHLIKPNVKLNYTFSRKFAYTVQNTENYDTYDASEKLEDVDWNYCE
jgi:hypothetical protein